MQIRENYLQGLRAVLPMNNPYMDALFKAWESSILGKEQALSYDTNNPKEKVKKAIKLNRIGWHWFRLVYPFFFDCFYLTSLCKPMLLDSQVGRFMEYCNFITRKRLWNVFEYFKNNKPCDKIPSELILHKTSNEKYAAVPLKRVLVVANVSAGKSTLINALIGRKLNKTATNACTKEICHIFGKPQEDGLTIKQRKAGKLIYEDDVNKCASDEGEAIGLYLFSDLLKGKKICFIDTPGYNDVRNPERKKITENAIKGNDYDAVMYVANAAYMGREDEQHLLETIVHNTKKPIIFVMNGLDKYKPSEDSISESVTKYHGDISKLGIDHPSIIPVSARAAFLARLEKQNLLEEDELFELEQVKRKFTNEYYDLPKYSHNAQPKTTNDMLGRTGINLLEHVISRI